MLINIQKENEKEMLIGIDQNLYLLKSNIYNNTQNLAEMNIQHDLLPVITRLT